MEKTILVCYFNVGNIKAEDIAEYVKKISKVLPKDEGLLHYLVPIKTGDSRIECVNPKVISEDEYAKVKEILDRNQSALNEILEWKKRDI